LPETIAVSLIILEKFGSLSIWPYLPSRKGHFVEKIEEA